MMAVAVAGGDSHAGGHSLAVRSDRSLWALGSNYYGQLGDGTSEDRSQPVKVMDGVRAVSAGSGHSLVVKEDGSLWAMGFNYYGELGDGTTGSRPQPVKVMDGVRMAAAGLKHSLVVKEDGSLWAMGVNTSGQLGDGTTDYRSQPVKAMDGVRMAAAGYRHSLVVEEDGSLWAMGDNQYGQLGDGTTVERSQPVKVMDGVSMAAAGGQHSLVVKDDGSLWAMGANDCGELGDGTAEHISQPVKVMDGVRMVAAGYGYSLVVKDDGSLWAMGANDSGELGDGTTEHRSQPVKVMDGVRMVAAGYGHSLVVKEDATLLWGTGEKSGLGLESNTSTWVPLLDSILLPHKRDSESVNGRDRQMWETRQYSDMTVCCQDWSAQAHRAVVACASPVLERMLEASMQEGIACKVELREISPQAVEAMLKWMYTGDAPGPELAGEVLGLAEQYQIEKLAVTCSEIVLAEMQQGNAIEALRAVWPHRERPHLAHIVSGVGARFMQLATHCESLRNAMLNIVAYSVP